MTFIWYATGAHNRAPGAPLMHRVALALHWGPCGPCDPGGCWGHGGRGALVCNDRLERTGTSVVHWTLVVCWTLVGTGAMRSLGPMRHHMAPCGTIWPGPMGPMGRGQGQIWGHFLG